MRALLTAIILAVPAASAQAPQEPDTVTFTRAQLEGLKRDVAEIIRVREGAAYEAGKADANISCGKLI